VSAAPWRGALPDPEHTEALGAALARTLAPATDGPRVIYLEGELGAGKTTLARGFLRALGVAGPVRSPTYTLVECYELDRLICVHLDLYRLSSAAELEALGVRELAAPDHVWLIEWPERAAGPGLPAADIEIRLRTEPAAHAFQAEPRTAYGVAWLAAAVAHRRTTP
jgi:tRNA threonylcarbamoyladenosine biosynthesis protein TsaE